MGKQERAGRGGTVPPISGRWPRGTSGNPKGRPPDLLREATLKRVGVERLAEILEAAIESGSERVLIAIMDRLWPKPPHAVELAGPDGASIFAGARAQLLEKLRRRDGTECSGARVSEVVSTRGAGQ